MPDNFFALKQPEAYDCQIRQYKWGGGAMHIRLKRKNSPEVQYLKFSGLEFFCGPLQWEGANFGIRSTADCLAILQKHGCVSPFVEVQHLEERNIRLYVVEIGGDVPVQIIANRVNRFSG